MMRVFLAGLVCWSISSPWTRAQENELRNPAAFDEEMSAYKATQDSGRVRSLKEDLERGRTSLSFEVKHGYLLSLLRELNIPAASQVLVASKTSPHKMLISPHNPRAIYYNDHTSVAYVPSADSIEIASADSRLGLAFYTLEQKPSARPKLVRDDRCLECHASAKTLDVPGLLIRSFLTKDDGDVDMLSGTFVTHRTPLRERWGGYYVTGTHGTQTHRGNLFGEAAIALHEKEPSLNGNIASLQAFLDTGKYPEPGSDIVALMVLEHQAHMQNLLTRLASESEKALSHSDNLRSTDSACDAVLRYMLFIDETRLVSPIQGTSGFAEWFARQGPRDKQGRSLRELDLRTRLFKYPCSYMIYSPAFEALPRAARRHFYGRLHSILLGEDVPAEFRGLAAETRKAIREILTDTASDLPVDWRL